MILHPYFPSSTDHVNSACQSSHLSEFLYGSSTCHCPRWIQESNLFLFLIKKIAYSKCKSFSRWSREKFASKSNKSIRKLQLNSLTVKVDRRDHIKHKGGKSCIPQTNTPHLYHLPSKMNNMQGHIQSHLKHHQSWKDV